MTRSMQNSSQCVKLVDAISSKLRMHIRIFFCYFFFMLDSSIDIPMTSDSGEESQIREGNLVWTRVGIISREGSGSLERVRRRLVVRPLIWEVGSSFFSYCEFFVQWSETLNCLWLYYSKTKLSLAFLVLTF